MRDLFLPQENILINSIKSLVDNQYRLHLITQSQYQDKFETEILEKVEFPIEKLTEKEREKDPFINAILIFQEKLQSLKTTKKVKEFLDYLMQRVILITIVASNQAFAVKLFQVLNTRGLDLTNTDIIKSYLYGSCEKSKRDQLKSTWSKIENIAGDVEEDLERLMRYYGLCILEKNPRTTLSAELLNHRSFKLKKSNKIAYEMCKFFEAYKEIFYTDSKLIFSFWNLPNEVYWKTIITTASYNRYNDFNGLAKLLRKFYYSYWIAGYTIAKVKQLSFNIIKWVKQNKPLSFVKKQVQQKMVKDKVVGDMKDALDREAYWERWHKPLLLLIEYNRTDDSKVTYIPWDRKLQTEHVLPEKWFKRKEWKRDWNKEAADYWLHRLGNLTLLSGSKNVVATNDPFKIKKIAYKKLHGGMTAFEISKEVAEETQWTEREVKKRHFKLKRELFDILGF